MEFAQYRSLEPVGFPAEVAKTRRGLGADHGDPDELDGGWEPLVAGVEPGLLEMLPDPCQLGGEVTEGVGRVNVLDDQIETVERIEADPCQAEDLDVGLQPLAGGFLELGGDALGTIPPDDPLCLSEDVTLVVPLAQGEIQVSVLAT